jgi:peptidoglycan/xylan/chitin deacetylase (PgdA/CDA1 family)
MGAALVFAYHAVSPVWPSGLAVSPERMRVQLERLVERGRPGATFTEVLRREAPARAIAVTFDDGYRSVLEHAFPLLSELGLPGTVFVPTDLVGSPRPMSWRGIDRWTGGPHEDELIPLDWDQLRRLRDAGWEIGSHTRTHPQLTRLGGEELMAELTGSREKVIREVGSCTSLAYPYGDHDDRVRAAAREAGYEGAATMELGPADPFRYPRVGVYPMDVPWRFRTKSSGAVRHLRGSRFGRLVERRLRARSAA